MQASPLSLSLCQAPFRGGLRPVAWAVLALLAGPALAQTEPLTLRATPLLAEDLPDNVNPPTVVYGDRITGRTDLETVIEGRAELRQPGRVAFGDDAAVAGGLVAHGPGGPCFLGDAIADPLSGIAAATAAAELVAAGRSGLVDVAMAGVAASFVPRRAPT